MTGPIDPRPPAAVRPLPGRLLRKELALFSPRHRFFLLGTFFLASLQCAPAEELFFCLALGLAGGLILYVPAIEWYHGLDPLLLSLPLGRRDLVDLRYLVALLALPAAAAAWNLAGRILVPLLDPDRSGPPLWATLEGNLAFLLTGAVAAALLLPLHFRFGLVRGALAALPLLLALALPGFAVRGWGNGPTSSLFFPAGWVAGVVGDLGSVAAVPLLLGGAALLLLLSRALSHRWFARREF